MRFATSSSSRIVVALILLAVTTPYAAANNGLVAEGRDALNAGRVDQALAIFEKAVAVDPNDPAALVWLGSAQVRKTSTAPFTETRDWFEKGFATMDRAVAHFPNAFVVYLVRGNTGARVPAIFGGQARARVAVADLQRVIAMRAENVNAVPDSIMSSVYLGLGLAYKHSGDPAAARGAWERGRALYPAAPEAATIEKELAEP